MALEHKVTPDGRVTCFRSRKGYVILYPHLWQMQIFRSFSIEFYIEHGHIRIFFPVLSFSFLRAIKNLSFQAVRHEITQNGTAAADNRVSDPPDVRGKMGKQIQRDLAQIEACDYNTTPILKWGKEGRGFTLTFCILRRGNDQIFPTFIYIHILSCCWSKSPKVELAETDWQNGSALLLRFLWSHA